MSEPAIDDHGPYPDDEVQAVTITMMTASLLGEDGERNCEHVGAFVALHFKRKRAKLLCARDGHDLEAPAYWVCVRCGEGVGQAPVDIREGVITWADGTKETYAERAAAHQSCVNGDEGVG